MIDLYLTILRVALIVLLLLVFIQDMKHRAISVAVLFFLFVTVCVFRIIAAEEWTPFAFHTAINFLFVVVQLCLLSVYIVFRFRVNVTSVLAYFGLGDLLFWMAICPLMNFPEFVIHFVASLLLALVLHPICSRFSFYNARSVPLAGMQSIYYCVSLGFQTYVSN
jgi:hypothetical protein